MMALMLNRASAGGCIIRIILAACFVQDVFAVKEQDDAPVEPEFGPAVAGTSLC